MLYSSLMCRRGIFAAKWLLAAAILLLASAPCHAQKPMSLEQVDEIVRQMQKAHAALEDYIAVMHQRLHREDGAPDPERVMFKFKKPFSVYMRWLNGSSEGREVLYVEGAHDGNMWVRNGSFPDITLCLAPKVIQTLSNSVHPVTEAGVGYIADMIARDVARAKSRPLDRVQCWDHGLRDVLGEPSRCFELVTPVRHNSGYYSHKAIVCQNQRTGLLNKITIWDYRNVLVEEYVFERIRVNVGLTAKDFDPQNPDYRF